jgi:DNA-directed RNA polymerase
MKQFTGLDYLKIDIANTFGLDKESWLDRLLWAEFHEEHFESLIEDASEPLLMTKAVMALRATQRGEASGHNMFLDATASGLQIMAVLSGCKETARHVNLINTGNREDVYVEVANKMNVFLSEEEKVTRSDVKKPLMTHFYNKKNLEEFFDGEQEGAFYQVLSESFTGAEAVMATINQYWNPNALEHTFTLPDGHIAHIKVTEMVNAKIEIDELDHVSFTYRFEANKPSLLGTSLCPNIIHGVDGYIAREMVRRSHSEGFQLAHIHDAFTAHPNNMQRVRELYVEILAEIADSNLLADILSEITGTIVNLTKFSNDLSADILASEYALS